MAFKFVALFALLAAASAAPQHYYEQPAAVKSYQPIAVKQVQQVYKHVEHEEPANYDFEYAVHDDHTGDIKEQHESAKDGAISGFYSLIDADGYRRVVHYTADDHHGFNAEVRREPVEGHKVAQPVIKKIVAQPIAVHKYEAPVQHQYYSAPAPVQHHYVQAAPVQHQYYSAPAPLVTKVVAPVVQKYVAPVQHHSYEDNHDFSSHVSFKGPSSNYSY